MSKDPANLWRKAEKFPNEAVAASRHADTLQREGLLVQAAAEYRRALDLDETQADAWYELGRVSLDLGATGEAKLCFRRTLDLAPERERAHFNLGKAHFDLGEIDAALNCFRTAANTSDRELREKALRTIAVIVPGSPRAGLEAVMEARRAWGEFHAQTESLASPSKPIRARSGGSKLRVGYVSSFFHTQHWMRPVWGVVNHHDRSAFEIHLFSDSEPLTAECGYQANPLDRLHDVRGMPNGDLAGYVDRAGIDILVDLNGYSYPERLGLFMRRPAPVTVAWFNMYATSGISSFDYIIGDAVVVPPSEERFYCERVLRVPGTCLAFSVFHPVPNVAPPPCLTNGHLTFGSFCAQYKFTDEVIAAWAMILRRAPQAQFLLKTLALGDATNRAELKQRFARWDIAPHRLLLEGPSPYQELLTAYSRVDIALDTFPYNGGVTTMDALWQGVPVLTFRGDRWAGRHCQSLLLAAGLDDWCVCDRDAYIVRAVHLAQSPATPAELTLMRSTMRERLITSPICDSAGLCQALERIYQEVRKRGNDVRSSSPRRKVSELELRHRD